MNRIEYIAEVLNILGIVAADIEIADEVRPLAAQAYAGALPVHLAAAAILAHLGAQSALVESVARKA